VDSRLQAEIARRSQGHKAGIGADDDVINQVDLEQLAGPDQVASRFDVGFTWRSIPRYAVCGISGVMPRLVLCRTAHDSDGISGGEQISDAA